VLLAGPASGARLAGALLSRRVMSVYSMEICEIVPLFTL
jgi:hypothetical protein